MTSRDIARRMITDGEIDERKILDEISRQLSTEEKLTEWRSWAWAQIREEIGAQRRRKISLPTRRSTGTSISSPRVSKSVRKSLHEQFLNKAVWVPDLDRQVRYRDLTADHCRSVAEHRFSLAARNTAWGQYYETMATEIEETEVTALGDLQDERLMELVKHQPTSED